MCLRELHALLVHVEVDSCSMEAAALETRDKLQLDYMELAMSGLQQELSTD